MRSWKRWAMLAAAAGLLLTVVYIAFNFIFLDFFVDLWWFESMGLKGYFLLRIFYRYLISSGVLFLFFLIFFTNFWVASRYVGYSAGESCALDDLACQQRHRRILPLLRSGSLKVYTPLSVLIAIPVASGFYHRWEEGLLFFFGPRSGMTDPAFGKDIGFYLFAYPVFTLLQSRLLAAFLVLLAALCLMYYVESRVLNQDDLILPRGVRIHLSIIASVLILIVVWGFFLERIALLYTDAHAPRFTGPGFIEMKMRLPLIWLSIMAFLATAISGLVYLHRRRGLKIFVAAAVAFVLILAVRNTSFLFDAIDTYYVQPNEISRERPYIDMNIRATLDAFNLTDVETRNYRLSPDPQYDTDSDIQQNLRNVPVWDRELLDEVFTQLQGIRTYYSFPGIDVDRYTVDGQYQQVFLAARELSLEKLPEGAQNWINRRLQYTHGYGAVMTPASQGGDEPINWFMRDLPLVSDLDFEIRRPQIYFGEEDYDYVIVPNDIGEIDHPLESNGDAIFHYDGSGGVSIASPLRKILFAIHFRDRNIFFTTKTNRRSRILYRQNIRQTTKRVTPFLLLDQDPYLVAVEEGLFWIQDGYTHSDMYPYARKYGTMPHEDEFGDETFNYIRNSVKIVIDAYNGRIDHYIAEPDDPIVRAYSRIYPGLLKPLDRMPENLRKHIRYPKQIFSAQMSVFTRYHQRTPEVFYREEDTWEFSKSQAGPMRPFYMTLNLMNRRNQEFMLLSPMSPVGRDNLRSLVAVGCDGENYGKMVVFSFPRGRQVHGPSQVSALINQDTDIAQEFTLWDQAGSHVEMGRMIVFPVGNTIIYIQPVYLRSTARLQIPELKRIIVSAENMVAMDRTLSGALRQLTEKKRFRMNQIRERLEIPGIRIPASPPEE